MGIRRSPANETRTAAWSETRERILDVARTLVVEDGWDRVSLRKVARRVGLSPPSLYEYFDGKDDMLAAVAERARDRLVARLRAVEECDERLVELALAYIDFARHHREDFLLLYGRSADRPPGKDSPYSVWINQVARELGPKVDLSWAAYTLWGAAHGFATLQVTALAAVDQNFRAGDRHALSAIVRSLRSAENQELRATM